MEHKSKDHRDYLAEVLDPSKTQKVIDRIIHGTRYLPEFDAIAVTGLSGLLVGPIVALELGLPLIVVRKDLKCAHSTKRVEGYAEGLKYIILDDFVQTGNTILDIKLHVRDYDKSCKLVGAILWSGYRYLGTSDSNWFIRLNVPVWFCNSRGVVVP